MVGTDFYQTGVTLDELDIAHLNKDELLDYLINGNFKEKNNG